MSSPVPVNYFSKNMTQFVSQASTDNYDKIKTKQNKVQQNCVYISWDTTE